MENNDKSPTTMKKLKDWWSDDKSSSFKRRSLIVLLFMILSFSNLMYEENIPTEVTYNEFLQQVEDSKIDTVYYSANSEYMRYTLLNEETLSMTKEEREKYDYEKKDWRRCLYPASDDFREYLLTKNINVVIKSFESPGMVILKFFANYAFLFIFLFYMGILLKQVGDIGKGNHMLAADKDVSVRFSDVIGHDEVIKDLKFIVKMMQDSKNNNKSLNANFPRGILFTGEPGTGKTLLAKAIAGEAGIPFLYMNASSFIEMYVGVGAKRVRELFKEAKKLEPCIIFIDEIDAIGQSRNRMNISSEDTQTINALLQEMDGFTSKNKVLVIAATNNSQSLDKALVRAGRFDREIEIAPPKDWTVRADLLRHYLKDKEISNDVNIEILAKEIVGFTGADIASIVNEAGIIALSKDSDRITMDHLEEAIDKKLLKGNRSSKKQEEKAQEICAYHEAGHAVMCYLLHHNIFRITIIGTTSGVGGFVMHADDDSNSFKTKKDMEDEIMIAYGGRCSEAIKYGEENITTGASSDIQQATNILANYVSIFGFKDNLINYQTLAQAGYTDNKELITKMNEIASTLKDRAQKMLEENYELVERLAQRLLEVETLSGDDVVKAIEDSQNTEHMNF